MSEQRAAYDLSPLGQAALEYARSGWWVFPLEPKGKKPLGRLVPNGLLQATTDEAQVREWWRKAPIANIGISCGPSRIVVIDVDERHGGDESIRDLIVQYPGLGETQQAATGGGGWHLVYNAPAIPIHNSTGSLAPGLDVRGVGGYIVAPPSIHPSGNAYEWYAGYSPTERKPATLPLPLIEALTRPEQESEPTDWSSLLEDGVNEGERDWQLFRHAASLRAANVPISMAYRLIGEAAAACVPPFPQDQARKKVESAYRYAPGKVAFVTPAEEQAEFGRYLLGRAITEGIPEPEWVIDRVLLKGLVCLMYGKPGCGKTMLMVGLALDLINTGQHVLFLDEENGPNMIGQRFQAMGAAASILDEYLHYFPFTGFAIDDMPKLDAYVSEVVPALIVMDSFGALLSASRLEENSNDDILKWMAAIPIYLARKYNCAVVIIDHITKEGKTEYSVGAGAKKRTTDYQWYVEQISPFDAKTLGQLKIKEEKNRLGVLPPQHVYNAGHDGGQLIVRRFDASEGGVVRPLTPTQQAVLAVVRDNKDDEGLYIDVIGFRAGRSERAVRSAIKELVERDLIKAEQSGTGGNKLAYFPQSKDNSATLQSSANREAADPAGLQPPRRGLQSVQGGDEGATLQFQIDEEDWER